MTTPFDPGGGFPGGFAGSHGGGGFTPNQLLSADSFNRPNSGAIGSTDGTGLLDPIAWVETKGAWGISGNAAYCRSGGSSPVNTFASLDLKTADVDLRIVIGQFATALNVEIIARWLSETNFWHLLMGPTGTVGLFKVVAGVSTQIGGFVPGGVIGDSLRLVMKGDSITGYWITAAGAQTLIASTIDAFNDTRTIHGIYDGAAGGATSTGRVDAWAAYRS